MHAFMVDVHRLDCYCCVLGLVYVLFGVVDRLNELFVLNPRPALVARRNGRAGFSQLSSFLSSSEQGIDVLDMLLDGLLSFIS